MTKNEEKTIHHCNEEAFFCFATAFIFEKKANRLRLLLKLIQFLGIIVPLLVGGVAISFGTDYLQIALLAAGLFSIIQLVSNAWAIVFGWEDTLAYMQESKSHNQRLSDAFKKLASQYRDKVEFNVKLSVLDTENEYRTESDSKQIISDGEKRMGHRAALRQFQIQCDGCKQIPKSMKPTTCDICGQF